MALFMDIHSIEGIFSGTLAYLFNVYDGQVPFSEVVRDANRRGYTEPDPRDDLSGMDVARKLIILGRDALLLAGYKLVVPRGYEFDVSFLGKLATWVVYAAVALVLVTEEGTTWTLVLLWIGIALSLGAGAQYALRAWRHVRAGRDSPVEREP